MSTSRWLVACAIGALGACAEEDVTTPPAAPTARELLDQGNTFLVDGDASRVSVHLTIGDGKRALGFTLDAPVRGGVAVGLLDDAGDLWVDELTLSHDSIQLPLGMGRGTSDGMQMAQLELRADGMFRFPDTVWSDDGAVAMTPDAAGLVTVGWDLAFGGMPFDRVEATTMIHTAAMVMSDDARVDLLIMGETHPVIWQWGELRVETSLDVSIDAVLAR